MNNHELIREHTQTAMQAINKAHEASKDLSNNPSPEKFDQFRTQMQEIIDHLTTLQDYLNHESAHAYEDLSEWLAAAVTGNHLERRHLQNMKQ
ncbi:MAG: hypothetical protein C3F07_12255 [Anaerolineales bacterium]|nr:hypothetical protein [Anaerolineae bacterium]PWB72301.1 MAG: hypothetical protein C3F07_12255 [Anaerolineales bacterium]